MSRLSIYLCARLYSFMMNHQYHILIKALFFVNILLSLTSCGDDDDNRSFSTNGRITVEEDGETTILYAYDDAQWHSGHLECFEGEGRYLSNGAVFSVILSENKPSDVINRGDHLVYKRSISFGFDAVKNVKQGKEVDIDNISWYPGMEYHLYTCNSYTGSVFVKSIKGNRITLQFDNFCFNRLTEFRAGDSSFQKITVNGEITFVNENIQDSQDEPTSSNDIDYSLPASGSLTVTDEKKSFSYVRQVDDAGYRLWKTDYNEKPSLSLKAFFKNEGSSSNNSFLSNHQKISEIYVVAYHLEKINKGKIADSGDVKVNYFRSDGRGYYDWLSQQGDFSGNVSITDFDPNKYITVKFTNCKFVAASSTASNLTTTKGYFSGEINFPLRDKRFFE